MPLERFIPDEAATLDVGRVLARLCTPGTVLYLVGELGAGKTTLARGFLRGLGYGGPVKSPTYTLVEPYEIGGQRLYHFDLYRLADPDELEYLGLRDCADGEALLLIEWPSRGGGRLPPADLTLTLQHAPPGRQLRISADSSRGATLLARLEAMGFSPA